MLIVVPVTHANVYFAASASTHIVYTQSACASNVNVPVNVIVLFSKAICSWL